MAEEKTIEGSSVNASADPDPEGESLAGVPCDKRDGEAALTDRQIGNLPDALGSRGILSIFQTDAGAAQDAKRLSERGPA